MINNIVIWIKILRPSTLLLSMSGIILSSSIAYRDANFFDIYIILFATFCVLLLQILSNLANDYGDGLKGVDLNRKNRFTQLGKVKHSHIKKLLILLSIFTMLLSFLYMYIVFVDIGYIILFCIFVIISVLAAILYTIGKNPYGYRGAGDVFVFIFFGLLNVVGSYFTFVKDMNFSLLLPACSLGFMCVAVLNVNNIRDYDSDKKSKKNTMVVYIGLNNSKIYHLFLILAAFLLSVIYVFLDGLNFLELIFLTLIIPSFYHIKNIYHKPERLNKELPNMVFITFLFSIMFGLGQILN